MASVIMRSNNLHNKWLYTHKCYAKGKQGLWLHMGGEEFTNDFSQAWVGNREQFRRMEAKLGMELTLVYERDLDEDGREKPAGVG